MQRHLRADRWNLMDLREMLDVSKTELCRGASEQSSRVECWNLLGPQEATAAAAAAGGGETMCLREEKVLQSRTEWS